MTDITKVETSQSFKTNLFSSYFFNSICSYSICLLRHEFEKKHDQNCWLEGHCHDKNVHLIFKAGERGGGAKYLGPGLVWGPRNLDKTSGHCAAVKRVGGP